MKFVTQDISYLTPYLGNEERNYLTKKFYYMQFVCDQVNISTS